MRGNGGVLGPQVGVDGISAKGIWTLIEQQVYRGARSWPGAIATIYGYATAGGSGGEYATTDRVTFATSVTAASSISNLSQARGYHGAISDCVNYGYAVGGYTGAAVATTDRITFSTSVAAARTASNLTLAKYGNPGISDKVTYGYTVGGYKAELGYIATTDRITFSTGVFAASTISNASVIRYYGAGVSDGVTYGYALGGYTGAATVTTDRITFSTSATAASTVSNLSLARYSDTGLSDGSVYGYVSAGYDINSNQSAVTDRIVFSTSVTAASTASNITAVNVGPSGISDGATFGYWLSASLSNRITFGTGVTATSTASALSVARYFSAGLSDYAV